MKHRTALITAGSIGIVVFAAAVAIGANLGILSVADSRPVGKLSASATAAPGGLTIAAVPEVVPKASTAQTDTTQTYIIKKAGTVAVAATKTGLRLVDVTVKRGFRWTLTQSADRKLLVTFKSHAHTFKFVAVFSRHRTIVARVDEPVTRVVHSSSSSGSRATAVAWSPAPTAAAAAPAPRHSEESDGAEGGGGTRADD